MIPNTRSLLLRLKRCKKLGWQKFKLFVLVKIRAQMKIGV
jgi:hypothetical protein